MGIVLYDKLPSLKRIPKAQEYSKSLEAEKVLEEVVGEEDSQTAIKTHRMNKAEINALSSNRRFEKGKSNPFADYSSTSPSSKPTTGGGSSGGSSSGGSSSGGKIFDDPSGK